MAPRKMKMVVVMLLWALARVTTAELCGSGQVVELDESSFRTAISECRHILVDFYAPWCSHCKALSPQLEKLAATLLPDELPELTVAKINVDKYTAISSKYQISEYPTIKLFVDGIHTRYDGPHKAELMLAHVKKLLAPELTYLSTRSAVDDFLRQAAGTHFPVFIAFGLEKSSSSELVQLAREHHARAWFSVLNLAEESSEVDEIKTAYGLSQLPAIVVKHLGEQDSDQQVFYGPFQGDVLIKFLKRALLPTVTSLSFDNLKVVKSDGRPILLVISNTTTAPATLSQLKTLATSHIDFLFALLNSSAWPALADIFHDSKLLIWTGQYEFYTADSEEQNMAEQVLKLMEDFRNNKAKRNVTKRPSMVEQLTGFLGQNFLYVILFIVTVVASLQGMDWNGPRPDREQ